MRPDVRPRVLACLAASLVFLSPRAKAGNDPAAKPYTPKIAPASDEALRALKTIRVPEGFTIDLFAAEPMLANPVAFGFDERGRVFVVETFRHTDGVTDTREHMNWLNDDLACRTVEDRIAMYRKYLTSEQFAHFGSEHDRIRLIEDRDGDGTADQATVFADGFHDVADGIGAGVLARKGDVWFTAIPHLWFLRDNDGDGTADVRRSLHRGYGVHVNFLGHDLHGLRFGPDGKLYFTIGDRGLNVTTNDGRHIVMPDTGSVLRCNPDGTELEVFAFGLRNPQELVFDQYGNLFTGDNNSDSGDRARFVYLVEGGDSGWRIGYQYLEEPNSRGPWNAEKLWHPPFEGQAAYIVPPVANIADGPSGLTHDPGTGLPERYRNHFFLCDFRGASAMSGIRSFAVQPKGASFELIDSQKFVWSVLATDADFGPDGALYFTDWVEGWGKPNKGRIYKVFATGLKDDPQAREVKVLLAEGMDQRGRDELARLLKHPDRRIRQEAQFALAAKGAEAIPTLARVARDERETLPRLHAIWGLGQIGRNTPKALALLRDMLNDSDEHVVSQSAKVLGDAREASAFEAFVGLLRHSSARVRFFAAMGLGKLGRREAIGPILALLRENADRDPYLRHAGVMGLTGIGDVDALLASARDDSAAARMGVLLALRRLARPEVARFLDDPEPRLVLEAARAIYDVPIEPAMAALARLTDRPSLADPALLRRAINANVRLGRAEHAEALAKFAAQAEAPAALRIEALKVLGDWAEPPGRDRVVGLWRPLPACSAEPAAKALQPLMARLLRSETDKVRAAAALAAGRLTLRAAAPGLIAIVGEDKLATDTRVEALKALESLHDDRLADTARRAADAPALKLRNEGRRILARVAPGEALPLLEAALAQGLAAEQQGVIAILATIDDPRADAVLARLLDKLIAGQLPPAIQLDVIEAASQRTSSEVRERLERYQTSKPKDDPLAPFRETLAGGDARRGRQIFFEKAEVSCLRCHKVRFRGRGEAIGGEVGPELTGLGAKQDRAYLLEAIVAPNRKIAEGFETLVLALSNGQVVSGILKKEDDQKIHLITVEGALIDVPKADIEDRKRGNSAMPDDLVKHLSKSELRDLIEFLASLKTPPASSTPAHGQP
jgi:quinoprotein glucose dehydrogenase